jgi:hypothetical protein
MMMMIMMMIHPHMHHQVMLPHYDQDLLSCTNLFQYYGIVVFILDCFCIQSFCSGTWPNTQARKSFLSSTPCRYNEIQAYVEPELGPNTGKQFFSEYNTMQIQRNASIEPNPETAQCMCHLHGTGPVLLRNSYPGNTLNAAQSKEVDVAMLPAVLARNVSARVSQVNTQGDTTLKPILPSMREAMLNQQHHAAVFEQQRPLLAEFEQRINCQQEQPSGHYNSSFHLLQFVGKVGQGIF